MRLIASLIHVDDENEDEIDEEELQKLRNRFGEKRCTKADIEKLHNDMVPQNTKKTDKVGAQSILWMGKAKNSCIYLSYLGLKERIR